MPSLHSIPIDGVCHSFKTTNYATFSSTIQLRSFSYSCFNASVYGVDIFGRFSCAHSGFIPFSAKGCWTTKKNRINACDAVLQRDYVGNAWEISVARVRRETLGIITHWVRLSYYGCAISPPLRWFSSTVVVLFRQHLAFLHHLQVCWG